MIHRGFGAARQRTRLAEFGRMATGHWHEDADGRGAGMHGINVSQRLTILRRIRITCREDSVRKNQHRLRQ